MKVNLKRLNYIEVTDKNINDITIKIADEINKYEMRNDGPSRQLIVTCPICYDTESSKYNNYSYVYIHQFVIGDLALYMRRTHLAVAVFKAIHDRNFYCPALQDTVVYIGIANSSHDLAFMQHELREYTDEFGTMFDVLASKAHKPIMATLESKKYATIKSVRKHTTKIIDICKISGMSLAKTGENYCVSSKKVGDLDYSLVRNYLTPLTKEEMDYAMFDVIVGAEFMEYLFETYTLKGEKFPITSTSIVRNKMIAKYKEIKKEERPNISALFPAKVGDYMKYMDFLFRGGYTHGNSYHMGKVVENVTCADYTSDYPACMVQELYPSEPFKDIHLDVVNNDIPSLDDLSPEFAFILEVEFTNIISRSYHSYESKEKLIEVDNPQYDNGRVFRADRIRVLLTEVDFDSYRKMYSWDGLKIISAQYSPKAPLPSYVTDVVAEAYTAKADLKRAGKSETPEYAAFKAILNAIYGCTVQRLNLDGYNLMETEAEVTMYAHYYNYEKLMETDKFKIINNSFYETKKNELLITDPDFTDEELDIVCTAYAREKTTEKAKQTAYYEAFKNKILSPFWGIWVTSYARNRLVTALNKCEDINFNCVVYYDTDSLYIKDIDEVKSVIDEWNDDRTALNQRIGLPEQMWDIGRFDVDPPCYRFKHLGAKRYIKEVDVYDKDTKEYHGKHVKTTVAGLKKGALEKMIIASLGDGYTQDELNTMVIDEFRDGMIIDEMFTGKLRPVYEYGAYSDIVVDYMGNACEMYQSSGVTLVEVSFKCCIVNEYLKHLEFIADYVPQRA